MILQFKFKYESNNHLYEYYLENILAKKDIDFKIIREKETISLYLEDEESKLIKSSEELSKELPMSIFLKDYTLEVVPQMPKSDYTYTTPVISKLSYCSKCFAMTQDAESKSFYYPFIDCDVCGATCDVKNIKFLEKNKNISFDNFKKLYEILADKISKGSSVKIKTSRGAFVFSKDFNLDEDNNLLCLNLEALNKIIVGSKEKQIMLSCIEKPSICFNINAIYQKNHRLSVEKVNITYAYDLFLAILSKELISLGIDFLSIKKEASYDYELTYEDDSFITPSPKIVYNDGRVLFLKNSVYNKNLEKIYNKFKEKSKSQFMVLLDENNLYEKTVLNFYCSTSHDDNISVFSEKIDGMLDVLNYKLPNSFQDIFDEIAESENGKKLLENYKLKFPKEYEDALTFDFSSLKVNSIYSFWQLVSVILNLDNILETVSKALLQKGPRVDYKLEKSDKFFNRKFEISKMIQSGMSFKLAGVDNRTLCLGYVESFVEFLSSIVDNVNEQLPIDGVSFCGDMISNELFFKLVNKSISKNFKLFYNKDFPIEF